MRDEDTLCVYTHNDESAHLLRLAACLPPHAARRLRLALVDARDAGDYVFVSYPAIVPANTGVPLYADDAFRFVASLFGPPPTPVPLAVPRHVSVPQPDPKATREETRASMRSAQTCEKPINASDAVALADALKADKARLLLDVRPGDVKPEPISGSADA